MKLKMIYIRAKGVYLLLRLFWKLQGICCNLCHRLADKHCKLVDRFKKELEK